MAKNGNEQLVEFFETAEPETIWAIIGLMDTFWQIAIDEIKGQFESVSCIPTCGSVERNELALKLAAQLRYYGSNGIAYATRYVVSDEAGVDYTQIVRDVMKLLNKELKAKAKIPRVASLSEYEQIICEQIIQIQFQGKSEEEIAGMLKDSGLDKEAIAHAKKVLAKVGGAGAGLIALVKLLGKKAVKEIMKSILIWMITRFVGKEAAQKLLEAAAAKLSQKLVAGSIAFLGWGLLAWDAVFSLTSPANRITVPCVAWISADRCMKRLKESEAK